MANIESHPEGFNALRRMYENFQEPLMDAAGQGNSQQDPLAALLGGAAAGGNASTGKLTCAMHPCLCLSDLQIDPEGFNFGGSMFSAAFGCCCLVPRPVREAATIAFPCRKIQPVRCSQRPVVQICSACHDLQALQLHTPATTLADAVNAYTACS